MIHCCQEFENALKDGTDNEAYSSAIRFHNQLEAFELGYSLNSIKFCPWCGANISKPHPVIVAAKEIERVRNDDDCGYQDLKNATVALAVAVKRSGV